MKKYLILFLVFLMMNQAPISGFDIVVHNINEKYELTKNRVNCMYQDSVGFLWFGMANGLYKFDLNTFTKYESGKNGFIGFPEVDIRDILEIKPGKLLIGTNNKGLLLFNSMTERYDTVTCDAPIDFSDLSINCLYESQDGTIWIGTFDGLIQISLDKDRSDKFVLLNIFNQTNTDLTSTEIIDIKESKDGELWFLTLTDIGFFNTASDNIESWFALRSNSSFTFLNNNQILKSCFETGLSIFNTRSHASHDIGIKGLSDNTKARFVFKDSQSNIWLSISNVGLMVLDSTFHKTEPTLISNKDEQYAELNSNVIYEIFETRDGAIWLCTEEGISMIKIKPDIFHSQLFRSQNDPDIAIGVRSLLDSKKGFIWTGTIGEGLKKFHYKSGTIEDVVLRTQENIPAKNIQTIMHDHQDNLWLGTEGEGVIRFKPGTASDYTNGDVINYRRYPIAYPENTINNDYIMALLEDKNENIWIGTWYGLSLLDSSELRKPDQTNVVIRNFLHEPDNERTISDNTVMSLLEDEQGNIWAGTQRGINKIIKTEKGYEFKHDFKNQNGKRLTEKKILVMYQNSQGNIWFSTQDGGICLLDTKSGIFHEYNADNGFHDHIINSITEDSLGILWLGTNSGLCRFNPSDLSYNIYTREDGLVFNDFYYSSNCKIDDTLYFGGNKGITFFHPYTIDLSPFMPNLVFTDFRLFNKRITIDSNNAPLKQHISTADEVALKHNQNYLTLAFAVLNYKQQDDIRYMCKMEGFESNWNKLNKERKMTYTNLNPGDYLFRVRAFSIGHSNNYTEISLPVFISPPFWKTTLAYILYILIIIFVIISIYRYFLSEERKKHALALERMNAKRTHELDMLKLQFYTNISHELRTPLTLISAPLETLLNDAPEQDKIRPYYQMMFKNVQRLKRLIDQLLDMRKVEEGHLKMEWAKGDIIEFIKRICANFENYAEKRKIDFTFHSAIPELSIYFDADKMDKVFFNLLSNAFKYTADHGSISLKIDKHVPASMQDQSEAPEFIEIKIADSGIGIPQESIPEIFKPFHQVRRNKPVGSASTGIGLTLTKELIDQHKGYVTVDSQVNVGSVFEVYLPVYLDNPAIQMDDETLEKEKQSDHSATMDTQNEIQDRRPDTKQKVEKPLVLIVEDNADLRKFLSGELREDYRLLEASNGEEGFQVAIDNIPDLIISDVMMDKMNGIELCNKIKTDERTSHVPVVLLTARHAEELIQDSYEMGADDYITKPFNVSLLKTRINNLVEQRAKLRKLFGKGNYVDTTEVVTNQVDVRFLEKLNKIIADNIDNPNFTPSSLATDMAMSKMQLYRKISALTNQTVSSYIRSFRMKKAVKLLLTTDMQIAEVAFSVGYLEPSNFTKSFQREFNQLPSHFVKTKRK